jgi:hypothetical protein
MSEWCQVNVAWISMQATPAVLRWAPMMVGTATARDKPTK